MHDSDPVQFCRRNREGMSCAPPPAKGEPLRTVGRRRTDALIVGSRGPTCTSVGALLNRYAHQFTLLEGGCDAELTRINHYLANAGLPTLRREVVEGRQLLSPVCRH